MARTLTVLSHAVVADPARPERTPQGPSADFAPDLDQMLDRTFSAHRRALVLRGLKDVFRPRRRYVHFLKHMTCHAKNVIDVMEKAAANLTDRPAARKAFLDHLTEEQGHDRLAREDLASLRETTDWEPTPCYLALEAYTQKLARERPVAVLGFLVTAEGLAAKFGANGLRLLKAIGFGAESTHFIRLHVEVDAVHYPQLRQMCLDHATEKADQDAILEAIRVTGHLMALA